ncbi:MAG TPA: ABC transporter permease, partial [Clostridiaceae bacterium]|nr:ABC transporter permease [Clostridiaceae bacterium]HBN29277.1 ABC transporter permease [Clostridiaceae bacterium]HCL49537.1 ABC transporter permease [Clostridiaceae bacterium]
MIRTAERNDVMEKKAVLIRIFAVALALLTSGLFIMFLGHNPIDVYISMIEGSFGTLYRFRETVVKTVPLVITSLGILIAFKMKFWNIGAEGQIYMGAFLGSFFALKFPNAPKGLLIPIMILAGIVGGGLYGLIPAFFKGKYDTNETLFTLMLNYIAIKWVTYLQYGPWKDPSANGFPKIATFSDNATLPKLLGINIGWVIAIILVILVHIFIHNTKKGYEIEVIGESENTARYAGINVSRTIMEAMFLSGGLCGLAGIIQASGVNNTLSVELSGGMGYTAIIVTWLSQLSAPLIALVSFLFALLIQGG